jgi:hypothetical protein
VAQLVETALLNQITLHTTLASKAARYVLAAGGRDLVDFAFRRTHGREGAVAVARAAGLPERGGGLPSLRRGPPEQDDVPGGHLRHDERDTERDRRCR